MRGSKTVTIGCRDENRSAKDSASHVAGAEIRLYYSTRELKAAALRAEHPDWTDEAIRQAVRNIFLYARD